jgi:hypothetical protein
VVIVVAAFAGFVFYSTKGAVDATRASIEAIKRNDLDKAYGQLSSSYQARMSREEFAAFVTAHPGLTDNRTPPSRAATSRTTWPAQNGISISSSVTEIATFSSSRRAASGRSRHPVRRGHLVAGPGAAGRAGGGLAGADGQPSTA